MDQELKQRLTGAVVITALAAIFIPMLFDDPVDQRGRQINELAIPPLPQRQQDIRSRPLPENTQDVLATPLKNKRPVRSSAKNKRFSRWFIQAGGFSQQQNAEKLRDRLRKQGFSATVKPKQTPKGLLYKVQVGPELSRKRAEQVQARLEKLNQLNSFITQQKTDK